MEGKALKEYLRKENITQDSVATLLDISRQTLNRWLSVAEFDSEQKRRIITALKLPEDFFNKKVGMLSEPSSPYGTTSTALVDCVREKAVLEERVAQLEIRLTEKDAYIKVLTKQLK